MIIERELTESERSTITNALRLAADRWAYNVSLCSSSGMAIQFQRQADEARKMADLIDETERITILGGE